jgi:hypothetical protein
LTPPPHSSYYSRMMVVELLNIHRKDIPLHYRREFTGDAVFELMNRRIQTPVEFVLERKPLGATEVRVHILEAIEYPLLPIIRDLKTFIIDLDAKGRLP